MTDKQIIGGRGSAKPYTTLNTVEVLLELEHVKAENILLREENAIHIRDWEDKKNENYELACKNEILKNENDRLKEARKNSRCAWKSLEGTLCPEAQEQLDKLKAENEGLKEFYNEWNPQIPTIVNTIGNANLTIKAWVEESNRLKQTITEIKEIAETFLTHCMGSRCDAMDDILQKINEVAHE